MAIENAETVEDLDLNLMLNASLALIQADVARKPLGHKMLVTFRRMRDTTAARRRTFRFVVPYDMVLETVAVTTHDMVGVTTVQITGDGGVAHFPITITGTAAAGLTKLDRVPYDGDGYSRVDAVAMPGAQVWRVWPKGTTITIVAETASVAASCKLDVMICYRTCIARLR